MLTNSQLHKKSPAMTYSPTMEMAVPSELKGLTSVFGMGTGGTPSLKSPDKFFQKKYVCFRRINTVKKVITSKL